MSDHDTPHGPASDQMPIPPDDGVGARYLRRRRRRRATDTAARPHRSAASRYQAYRQGLPRPTTPPPTPAALPAAASMGATALPATPLATAFARAEQEQRQARNTRGRRLRAMTRKRWFWPLVGVPGTLLLVALLALSPVIYQAISAYRDVQVDSVEHIQSAYVPRLNVQGTPELVAVPTERPNEEWTGKDRITILLLGVDKAENGAARTDTLILVNIDPVEKSARMLSIPRDLKVVIPGYGTDKINAAFAIGEFNEVQGGGAGLTIRTIEANLGIPVENFVKIDFQGFIRMIDTIGGITIDVPYPIKDDEYPDENYRYQRIYFPAGWQHMDGATALKYARTRHMDGDARRSARQQQVLLAIRDQAIDLNLLPQLPTLIGQFGDSVRTDISINNAVKLARLGTEIPRDRIVQTSLMPALYEEQDPEGPYFLEADWEAVGEVLSEFAGEEISPPGAALANPDYSLPILIENGTDNEGLAGRVGTVLEQNGFWNVDVALTDSPGSQEQTEVLDNGGNLGTSALVTNLIGVGADRIAISGLASDDDQAVARSEAYDDYAIVITLGDDAPDPADSEWDLDDYQEQVGEDGGGAVPATDTTEEVWVPEDSEEDGGE